MTRWRLVSTQNEQEHISSVILTEDEAVDALHMEADLHRLAGWTITEGDRVVVARRRGLVRVLEARAFDVFADVIP